MRHRRRFVILIIVLVCAVPIVYFLFNYYFEYKNTHDEIKNKILSELHDEYISTVNAIDVSSETPWYQEKYATINFFPNRQLSRNPRRDAKYVIRTNNLRSDIYLFYRATSERNTIQINIVGCPDSCRILSVETKPFQYLRNKTALNLITKDRKEYDFVINSIHFSFFSEIRLMINLEGKVAIIEGGYYETNTIKSYLTRLLGVAEAGVWQPPTIFYCIRFIRRCDD